MYPSATGGLGREREEQVAEMKMRRERVKGMRSCMLIDVLVDEMRDVRIEI